MTTLRQAAQQARQALETLMIERESIYDKAITAIKEALAQPEQEPVAWMFQHDETGRMNYVSNDGIHNPTTFIEMNPRYALVCPLYTAPPLPVKPEPVTWDKPSASFNEWWDSDRRRDNANPFATDSFSYWAFEGWQAALAQRQWVGLTDEEIEAIGDRVANEQLVGPVSNFRVRLAQAIEQTLKERNG